jgi:hypothetical protein
MRRRRGLAGLAAAVALSAVAGGTAAPAAQAGQTTRAGQATQPTQTPATYTGTLNGVAYLVDVPAGWNGTLLLWNHAYDLRLTGPEDADGNHPEVKAWLLAHGYALAGIQYPNVAYPTPGALGDDFALLSWFRTHVGRPGTTLAWGESLGGTTTAALAERAAPAFDGALPMCGETAGALPFFNALLDAAYTLNTLVWPKTPVQIAHIGSPAANQTTALAQLAAAWQSADPRTQARLALAAALADIPGWADSLASQPTALNDRIDGAVAYLYYQVPGFLWGTGRSDTETLLGGNPSWNLGVDYRAQLAKSASRDLVEQAYAAAGGSAALDYDLAALNAGPRVAPDPGATAKLVVQGTLTGAVGIPVLTLHDTGDGVAPVENEGSYAEAVGRAGRSPLLRQVYAARANHCFFTGSEEITALQTLFARVKTGQWPDTSAGTLNAAASTFGPEYQQMDSYYEQGGPATVAPALTDTQPPPFVRALP